MAQGRTTRPRSATAAVELAFAMTFLSIMFVGILDFGRVYYYGIVIDNCARNGATFACAMTAKSNWQGTSGTITSATDAALAEGADLSPPLTTTNVTVTTVTDADGKSASRCSIVYTFNTITGSPFTPQHVTLRRTVQMRK